MMQSIEMFQRVYDFSQLLLKWLLGVRFLSKLYRQSPTAAKDLVVGNS